MPPKSSKSSQSKPSKFSTPSFTSGSVILLISYAIVSIITLSVAYRVRHVRLCIQSVDPSRLPSQCVYCRNRIFPLTVRVCTSGTYLPARMTVNEGFCLVNACRRQLPKMPPEPYQPETGNQASIVGAQSMMTPSSVDQQLSIMPQTGNGLGIRGETSGLGSGNGLPSPSGGIEPVNSETGSDYEEAESVPANAKARPPAKFYMGKPQKLSLFKFRPMFFG